MPHLHLESTSNVLVLFLDGTDGVFVVHLELEYINRDSRGDDQGSVFVNKISPEIKAEVKVVVKLVTRL